VSQQCRKQEESKQKGGSEMPVFKTADGNLINAERVWIFKEREDGYVWARGAHYGPAQLDENYTLEDVRAVMTPVIPAQPGFELLRAWWMGDDEVRVERTPIIGWRTGIMIEPVTAEKDQDYASPWNRGNVLGVRFPDGQIDVAFENRFSDETEWLKYAHECQERDIKAHEESVAAQVKQHQQGGGNATTQA
jgi:hypothetical protein